MSIQELSLKFKGFFLDTGNVLAILIVFVSVSSFYLGKASVIEHRGQNIGDTVIANTYSSSEVRPVNTMQTESSEKDNQALTEQKGEYVASKNGTKYHLPWCGGAKQIKEENKVWFETKEEAERAGYSPASNCKGI